MVNWGEVVVCCCMLCVRDILFYLVWAGVAVGWIESGVWGTFLSALNMINMTQNDWNTPSCITIIRPVSLVAKVVQGFRGR